MPGVGYQAVQKKKTVPMHVVMQGIGTKVSRARRNESSIGSYDLWRGYDVWDLLP